MSEEHRQVTTTKSVMPRKHNRAHRFTLALQRLIALQEYNPMGGDRDG